MAGSSAPRGSKTGKKAPDSEGGTPPAEPPFEEALERLQALVDRLEQGDLDLVHALAAFEEGVALSRRCTAQLETAERRVEVLMADGSSVPLEDSDS